MGHSVLYFKYVVKKSINEIFREKRNWRRGRYEAMSEDLNSINWNSVFSLRDLDGCYNLFVDTIHSLYHKHIPLKKISLKYSPPWFTLELKKLISMKHRLWYKMRASGNAEQVRKEYEEISYRVKTKVKIAVEEYEYMLANKSKHDPKLIYQYVKSKQSVKLALMSC